MFCPKCGMKNNADIKFCEACGAEMIDNQPPVQRKVSADLLMKGSGLPKKALNISRKGLDLSKKGLEAVKKGIPQFITKLKSLPKIVKMASAIALALFVAIIAFSMIGSTVTGPESVVNGYFKAKTNGDWNKVFGYLSINESEFVNKDSFNRFMENESKLEIVNYKISGSDSGFLTTYTVSYLTKGSSARQTEVVTLVKTGGKRLLFFDDYRINADGLTVSNYQIHIPQSAVAYLNDIELIQALSNEPNEDFSTFIIPDIFPGIYSMKVEHPEYGSYSEQIQIYQYGNPECFVLCKSGEWALSDSPENYTEAVPVISEELISPDPVISYTEAVPLKYDTVYPFQDGVALVILNNKCGLVDKTGKEIVPCIYDSVGYEEHDIYYFTEDMIPISSGGTFVADLGIPYYEGSKYGFLDKTGKEVITPKYDLVGHFSDGMAQVMLGDGETGKWGFIDKTCREIVPPGSYDFIQDFIDGMAAVSLNGKSGFIDKSGREVVLFQYDYAESFSDGFACVMVNVGGTDKWGAIDKSGREIVPCKYDVPVYLHNNMVVVNLNGKCGVIDNNGKEVVPIKYDSIDIFSDGLIPVSFDGKWGFIDRNGNEVVSIKYDLVGYWSEGLTPVNLNGKWGFIDNNGSEIVSSRYDFVESFSDGIAAVSLNEKYGFIDLTGKEVVPPKYDFVQSFSDGIGLVRIGDWDAGKWGFVDKTGKEIVPCKYDQLGYEGDGLSVICSFSEGLIRAELDGKMGLIDNTGTEIIPFKYGFVGEFSSGVVEVLLGDWESWETGQWGVIDKTGREIVPFGRYDYIGWLTEGMAEVRLNGKCGFISIE